MASTEFPSYHGSTMLKYLTLGSAILHLLWVPSTVVGAPPPKDCFDLSKKVVQPLRAPIPLEKTDVTQTGKTEEGYNWAQTRGRVPSSLNAIYTRLLDHYTIKNKDTTELTVTEIKNPNYLALHYMKQKIRPFLFITVEWDEEWAYALAKGTVEDPKEIVISYQYKGGTAHINHLCGNIVLNYLTPKETDIYFYEEMKASHWDEEDALKNFAGTLSTLRGEKPKSSKNDR